MSTSEGNRLDPTIGGILDTWRSVSGVGFLRDLYEAQARDGLFPSDVTYQEWVHPYFPELPVDDAELQYFREFWGNC